MAVDNARVKSLFLAATDLADPAARAAYLDRECGRDADLRGRVEALLEADAPIADASASDDGTSAYAATSDASARDEQAGAVLAGKYKLGERIGEGGMGSVWVAQQSEPVKRKVAVKLIKAGMDTKQVLARFDAERQALALMDHPNIAKVLDGGSHDGRPFFVMELVKGVPITDHCDANKLTPKERLELFVPVCQAIQHAHQKGIIHRDIKPTNVLVALYDDKPVVKVIDFGVAKATGGTLTEATIDTGFGGVVGTPQYMSPEQATFNNLDIDTRSDVYALGVLLYELLTGSPPFSKKELEKRGLLEMLRVVREEEPPRPSTKLSSSDALPSLSASRGTEPKTLTGLLRNELDWIVMKALEKNRSRRYETANGFAADVNRYLSGEAVQAHPPSTGYRLKKFVRRNRGQVIAAGLVLLALLGGIAGTTFGLIQAREAKERESARADGEEKAKVKAVEAEAAAVAEKKKAVEFRNKALDALRATTGTDVEKLLGEKKELTANEKAYLDAIAQRWQSFAKQEGTDEQSRAIAAEGHHRVASLWDKLGRRNEARPEYEQAVAVFEKLADDFPAVPGYRRELAGSHNNLGILLDHLGKRAEAEEQYGKGLAILQKLAADFPADPVYRSNLAASHNNLGVLLKDLGKPMEAEEQSRKGLAIQHKLAADFPAVHVNRSDLAGSHTNLGLLLVGLGKRAEATEQYGKALVIQEKLAADFPAVPVYRSGLAGIHNNLGILLVGLGKRPEATEQYGKALVIQEKLAADFPAVPAYRSELAGSHTNLGLLLVGLGKRAEAEEQYRKALVIQEKLAADFPAVPAYRSGLAGSHTNLGLLLDGLGKRAEAEEQYRKRLALREKLAADFPAVPEYRIELGGNYCNFGILVRDGGKPADSLAWFDKAIKTLRPVHESDPRAVTAKLFLQTSHSGRAIAHDSLGRHTEAVKDWDKTVELSPPPEQPTHRASRAISLLHAGKVAQAVAEVAELTKLPAGNADQWYNFACFYAVASGKVMNKKVEYADQAMELLQKAVQAGWKDAAHMKKDTDLAPLRNREDFKKLLTDLEAKTSEKK
jgi:serine/threonine protein kinase/tetratricopeptide (TPR) repeat protein